MKARNPITGNFENLYVKALDGMPVGTTVDYTGSESNIPVGWEKVSGQNKITKTSQNRALAGRILNIENNSNTDTYSAYYINNQLNKKFKIYNITPSNTFNEVQQMMEDTNPKILNFAKGNYTYNNTFRLNANTTLLFNNSVITFNIPKVTEDDEASHGFFNFKKTDTFTGYNGNGNIEFIGGTIVHGNVSFCHAKNIKFINMDFELCYTQHIFELCALDGVLVKNCIFNGTIAKEGEAAGINKEYINIDPCVRGSFPWFNTDNNIPYDHTVNKNIEIVNCEFKVPNDNLYTGGSNFIGNHTNDDGYRHSNIIIRNNIFNGTKNLCIQFKGVENVVIEENEFSTSNTKATSTYKGDMIRFHNDAINIKILNNNFYSNMSAIRYIYDSNSYTAFKWIIDGNKFNWYITNMGDTIRAIIDVKNLDSCQITNNIFDYFSQTCIDTDYATNQSSNYYYISNNVFQTISTLQNYVIRALDGYAYINDNTFNIPSYNNNKIISLGASSSEAFISNNNFSRQIINNNDELKVTGYTESYENIKNIGFATYSGNVSSLTNETPAYPFSNFTNLRLTLGSGENTNVVELKGWPTAPYLDNRTYYIPVYYNGSMTYVTFIINSNGTFSYNSDATGGNIKIRNIMLYNDLY